MKRMLINATQAEERRLAMVDGQKLLDYEIEVDGREQRKGNIYKAVITRIEPSLEACFVDYGEERHGFLPFKEVSRAYFSQGISHAQAKMQDVLKEGQELIVQVEKEERGNKGAAITTFISLAGRYIVLMPNNPRGGGVSRRIEGEERAELKEAMDQLEYPNGMSIIARTAGIGRSAEELQWDINYLLKLWAAVEEAGRSGRAPFLIFQESSLVIRAIRDHFDQSIGEILVDTPEIYEQARQFMMHVMPTEVARVKKYTDETPLFSRFQIEHQIESAYAREVKLPSGGVIVIDHTEALVAVDVNSARSIRGGDIEETATRTNLEAADELSRQLRLRDIGGLIVIDFIDMEESRNRREVENRLREALRQDRARVQIGTISKLGLMEMSRQRLRPSLSEGVSIPCPRCGGHGHIRDTETSALQILRIIQEEAMKESTANVICQVPVPVASFLLNEKRVEITKIEIKQRVTITVVPNKTLETPHYDLERIKTDDANIEQAIPSYELEQDFEGLSTVTQREKSTTRQQDPVIKGILPDSPAPKTKETIAPKPSVPTNEPSILGGFFAKFKQIFSSPIDAPATQKTAASCHQKSDADSKIATSTPRNHPKSRQHPPRDRADKGERSDVRGERKEKTERTTGNNNRSERANATEKPERKERGERQDRYRLGGERKEKNEQTGRGERPERNERAERSTQPSRAQHRGAADRHASPAAINESAVEPQKAAPITIRLDKPGPTQHGAKKSERPPRAAHNGSSHAVRSAHSARSTRDEDTAALPQAGTADTISPGPSVTTPIENSTIVAAEKTVSQAVESTQIHERAISVAVPALPPELSFDELASVTEKAGLMWVHSNPDRVRVVQAIMAAETPIIHVPREIPDNMPVVDEALVLVETRKDLRYITLPFERR